MVDPEALGSLQLTGRQVADIPAQLWPIASVREVALGDGQARLPLSTSVAAWSLQWQQNEALRAEVRCGAAEQAAGCPW